MHACIHCRSHVPLLCVDCRHRFALTFYKEHLVKFVLLVQFVKFENNLEMCQKKYFLDLVWLFFENLVAMIQLNEHDGDQLTIIFIKNLNYT